MEMDLETLANTRNLILGFPDKISYDCMVPLSSVAFAPGQIVHTNEFKCSETNCWYSFKEMVAKLDKRIQAIEGKIVEPTNPPPCLGHPDPICESEIYPVLEIREFIDDHNNLIHHELVDVEKEMGVALGKLKLKGRDENEHKTLLDTVESTLTNNGSATRPLDDHDQLVMDLARIDSIVQEKRLGRGAGIANTSHTNVQPQKISSGNAVSDDDSDWFSRLQREEELAEAEAVAAARFKLQEQQLQASQAKTAAAPGWKKGFFGSAKTKPTKAQVLKSSIDSCSMGTSNNNNKHHNYDNNNHSDFNTDEPPTAAEISTATTTTTTTESLRDSNVAHNHNPTTSISSATVSPSSVSKLKPAKTPITSLAQPMPHHVNNTTHAQSHKPTTAIMTPATPPDQPPEAKRQSNHNSNSNKNSTFSRQKAFSSSVIERFP